MNKDDIDIDEEQTPDTLDMVLSTMSEFRMEMEYYDDIGTKIAAKTRFIMRTVFTTLLVSSLYLGYMIFQMATNMSNMTTHLEDMYSSFGTMSDDMHAITQSVTSMGDSITGIPVIVRSMTRMDDDLRSMNGSVFAINQNITAIDNDMIRIKLNMQDMNGRLSGMNRSVNAMSYDVNEMAQPMNSGPLSGFWPR